MDDTSEEADAVRALRHLREQEEEEGEEEEVQSLLALQSMLDSFYENVSNSEPDGEADDEARALRKRRRPDVRRLRYSGRSWTAAECIRIGWFTVREEPHPPDGDAAAVVEERDVQSEVELVVVERSEPSASGGVRQWVRSLQFVGDGLVRRAVRTRTADSAQRRRQRSRRASQRRTHSTREKARDTIRLDVSDSEDSAFSSPASEQESDDGGAHSDVADTFTTSEVVERSAVPLTAPIPLHPLSVVHTHRPDNAIDERCLHAVVALFLKGFVDLRCQHDAENHCFRLDVWVTPLAMSGDGRPSWEERRMLGVVVRWACECGQWEEAEQISRDEAAFDPSELYAAALPPKRPFSSAATPHRSRTNGATLPHSPRSAPRAVHEEERKQRRVDDDEKAIIVNDNDDSDDESTAQLPSSGESHCVLTQALLSSLGLLPVLRPYQLRAASWMLQREVQPALEPALHLQELNAFWKPCRLYEQCPSSGATSLWYDVVRAVVTRKGGGR